ncbi:MAG: hypothetical protein R2795_07295 [Saprospiraceae bacterium]
MGERVMGEQNPALTTTYQERLYTTGFREVVQRRIARWASQPAPTNAFQTDQRSHELKHLTDELLDYFFILHCQDLNTVVLPEDTWLPKHHATLGGATPNGYALFDFEREQERWGLHRFSAPAGKNSSKTLVSSSSSPNALKSSGLFATKAYWAMGGKGSL